MALRTSLAPQPHLYMGDMQGRPLDAGKVYFGEPNKDPELYPINVYYDEALTIAAPQPVRTMGGFMNANGQMVEIYAAETEYSVKVLDGYGRQVFYQARMVRDDPSAPISVTIPYPNAVPRYQGDKNAEIASLKDFGAVGNGVDYDEPSVDNAATAGLENKIDGNNLTYAVGTLPTDYDKFKRASFKNTNNQEYPTEDMYGIEYSQITKTPNYTGWAEHKSFVWDDVIYVPVDIAHEDGFNKKKIGVVKSFDGGATWTSPEILVDEHPSSTLGWNTFSMGVMNGRMIMMLEERKNSDRSLNDLKIYDRIIGFSSKFTNPVSLTTGSSIATITIPKHGLVAGDKLYFSSVKGEGVAGLSGKLIVQSVIDENTFTVDKTTPSTATTSATGGSPLIACTFYDNAWRKTSMGIVPNAAGLGLTHCHSMTVRDSSAGRFFVGYHNGSTGNDREVGLLDIANFWQTPAFTKRRLPTDFETGQVEPSVVYHNSKTYLVTRGNTIDAALGAVLCISTNDGISWSCARIPGALHYDNIPLVIKDNIAYMFTSERRPNEFDTLDINHNIKGRTRAFMLELPLIDADNLDFTNLRKVLLGYGIYSGEQQGSSCGVGSALSYKDDLFYFLGGENYALNTRYSLNTYDIENEYIAGGYQPDVFCYRIPLKKSLAGLTRPTLRCPDSVNNTVYRYGQKLIDYTPYVYAKKPTFTDGADITSGDLRFARYLKGINATFNGIMPDTSSGSDTSAQYMAGGGALSSSRGAMLIVHGKNHAQYPDEVHFTTTKTFTPANDGVADIGKPTNRLKDIYTVNSITSTSDENMKDIDGSPPPEMIQPLLNIAEKIKVWKWKDGGVRKHIGVIAQEVYAEFEAVGIDAFDYGFVGKNLVFDDIITDQNEDGIDIIEKQPRLDAEGNQIYIWSVRHGELQYAILWAQIQKLKELI